MYVEYDIVRLSQMKTTGPRKTVNIQVCIPEIVAQRIDQALEQGEASSRSEFVRLSTIERLRALGVQA